MCRAFSSAVLSLLTARGEEQAAQTSTKIPTLILLLSPGLNGESDSLVRDVRTTRADGGSPSACTSTTLLGEDKGGVLPKPLSALEREGVLAAMGANLWGLPQEGVVPGDLLPPIRSPGWHP
jgi:hypothetical protein